MRQQTVAVSSNPNILIESIPGDLRLAGWDRLELMAKADGDVLEIISAQDPISISCDEDLILYLPRGAKVTINKVAGDAILQAMSGQITLGPVAGDLTLNDLGPITIESVAGDASLRNTGAMNAETISGDFVLRGARGPCAIGKIGGDGSVRDLDGMLTIDDIGADLYVRNVQGAVTAKVGADATIFLSPLSGQVYDITAGDDLIVRLSPETNVKLHLNANSPGAIRVDFPDIELPEDCTSCEVLLGSQVENLAEMLLTAGGDLLVTNQADRWKSASDFDSGEWRIPPIPPISPLSPEFSERINRRVQASMERAKVHLEAANRRAEAKIQATVRRAEMKARAAEVRSRRGSHFNVNIGRWNWDLTPQSPSEKSEPVSDDERLVILRMLKEKKINLEEAEKLLAALEGK